VAANGARAVLNDRTSPDFAGFLTSPPTGLERAGVRESADVLPEADGGIHGAFYRDRLPFTLAGIIDTQQDNANTAAQDRLLRATNALRSDALLKWTPSTIAEGVQVAFREQQPTRITDRRPKSFLVAGVAEDPLIYSQRLKSMVIDPSVASAGGFTSPMLSPLGSGATIFGQAFALNDGSADTWPVITLRGPCVNPSMLSATLGYGIAFTFTLGATDELVVETNPRRRSVSLGTRALAAPFNLLYDPNFLNDTPGSAPTVLSSSGAVVWQATTTGALIVQAAGAGGVTASENYARMITPGSVVGEGASATTPETVNIGASYRASMYLKGAVGGEIVELVIGTGAGQAVTTPVTLTTTWQRVEVALTATSAATTIAVAARTVTAVAQTFYVARAMITTGLVSVAYVDGGLLGMGWLGAAGQSASGVYAHTGLYTRRFSALDFVNSRWWPLVPGTSDLRLGFASFTAGAHALLEWRDAWG
jgi:hypothetical protein